MNGVPEATSFGGLCRNKSTTSEDKKYFASISFVCGVVPNFSVNGTPAVVCVGGRIGKLPGKVEEFRLLELGTAVRKKGL